MGSFFILHIIILSYVARHSYTLANADEKVKASDNELLYCHFCGFVVGDTSQIVYIPSDGARYVENKNISGKSIKVQTLENPFKYFFDVVTTYKANCLEDGLNMRADSWYPGYSWRVCKCPHCKYHLGWSFEGAIDNNLEDTESKNSKKTFYALILQALYGSVGLQNMRAANESSPLFLDTPIEIKKPQISTPAVTESPTTAEAKEAIPIDDTAGGTIVILKKRVHNVTTNGTHADNVTRNSSVME